jgi:hypothetical protein
VNLTPMCSGLLPNSDSNSDSITFLGQEHDHQESHRSSHSLLDVRTARNNAAEHTAEIAVASHRAAEIE